jgi:hypothetical protein
VRTPRRIFRGTLLGRPAPETEGTMPKYRLFDADGNDIGEMRLGDVPFRAGDEIFLGPGKTLRVLDVVPVEEEDSPYVGLLRVEAA